ncbi:FeoB-associated Cys-rich membrane protein [Romboutsia sp.]|uniref:FeoB-associated Cys-rich membrane protein n=1 Tax=Romboutsia sp. TaxID=1965302 RepID=UPI003F3DA3E9
MADMIVVLVIVAIVYFASKPIIEHRKQMKKGNIGCIGCSQASKCTSNSCNIE